MSRQQELELVDRVAAHLLRQGRKAIDRDGDCQYRTTQDGTQLACAAGCLIDDEHYTANLEGKDAREPAVMNAVANSLGWRPPQGLVLRLQEIHDSINTEHWPEELGRLRARVAAGEL